MTTTAVMMHFNALEKIRYGFTMRAVKKMVKAMCCWVSACANAAFISSIFYRWPACR
jgi:hypothetical protein